MKIALFLLLFLFQNISSDKKEKNNEENIEENYSKEIKEKLDKYIKTHNLESKNTIDKKEFLDLFINVTISEDGDISNTEDDELEFLKDVGTAYCNELGNEILVSDLHNLLEPDKIMKFIQKLYDEERNKDNKKEDF